MGTIFETEPVVRRTVVSGVAAAVQAPASSFDEAAYTKVYNQLLQTSKDAPEYQELAERLRAMILL